MSKLVKSSLTNPELKLIQDNSDIHCYHCGNKNYKQDGHRNDGIKRYFCRSCNRSFSERKTNSRFTNNLTIGEDIWHADDLGLRISKQKSETKLVFLHIKQQWLKEAAKKFVKYGATTKQLSTLKKFITAINCFSEFVFERFTQLNWSTLTRSVIIDYLDYLNSKQLNWSTKKQRLSSLKQLLEIGKINSWFEVSSYLIRPEDFPKSQKRIPRYIPEEIMEQLNRHIDNLPDSVMRMTLVLQETGLRVGELLQLKLNCLKQDTKGDWFIQFINWKMNKEDIKPISLELAKVIQEQQQYIKLNFLEKFDYLFCARKKGNQKNKNPFGIQSFVPEAKVMSSKSFIRYLKKLAKQFNICDSTGQLWDFQSHQFRHTVGTRMINNGVPQHIIQRYLGHETPTMTSVYAHIHDQTLKKEIAKYHDSRVVNVAGEVVESTTPELDNDLDLHLLKKKVLAQSLPNGSCARPIVLGECPHANACFTCGDFRTTLEFLDQHKVQLEETEKLVKNAEEKGWKRHAEMNTKVRDNLQKIITTLESGTKDIVSGGDE